MVKMDRRPRTATLIKPAVLDTKLLGIFDMSTLSRDHLLAIRNLIHSTPRCKCTAVMKTFSIDCPPAGAKLADTRTDVHKAYKTLNKTYRVRRNEARSRLLDTSGNELSPGVPVCAAPCVTCGRQNQPERFHSHPSRVDIKCKEAKQVDQRKTVQKPLAIKFRSARVKDVENRQSTKRASPSHSKSKRSTKGAVAVVEEQPAIEDKENNNLTEGSQIKMTTKWKMAVRKNVRSKGNDSSKEGKMSNYEAYKLDSWTPAPISGGRKRKVVCYLCSQEIGTAALPSHEAQCIRKYLNGNNDEETSRTTDSSVSSQHGRPLSQARENWKLAWELTQASLIPCCFCDRKFLPTRLETHKRICASKSNKSHTKTNNKVNNAVEAATSPQSNVFCEHCSKWFNTSLPHHRDHVEKYKELDQQRKKSFTSPQSSPRTVVCYICGRNFDSKSVRSHEQQCLKKWLLQHERLPLNLANTNTSSLENDAEAEIFKDVAESSEVEVNSQELFWKAHQAKLVPCEKCSRTFYPHRLDVHLKGCKGITKKIK